MYFCDYGTSNTVLCYSNDSDMIEYVYDSDGSDLICSSLYMTDDFDVKNPLFNETYFIGKNANVNYEIFKNDKNYFYQLKRLLGVNNDCKNINTDFMNKINNEYVVKDDMIYFSINGGEISLIKLISLFFDGLKIMINREEVMDIYVSTPAYFNDLQKQQLVEAYKFSGFNVKKIYNEPSSAAMAYINKYNVCEDKKFIVYDFGCGTLDITTVEYHHNDKIVEIIDIYGNNNLGSLNIDDEIMMDIYTKYNIDYDNKKWKYRIRKYAEEIKKAMSYTDNYSIVLEDVPTKIKIVEMLQIQYSKTRFNDKIKKVVIQATEALNDIMEKHGNIHDIIFVGGGTLIDLVRIYAKNICKINSVKLVNKNEYKTIVVQGLFVLHDIVKNANGLLMTDITAVDFGIMGSDGNIVVVIPKGTKIPISKDYIFSLGYDGQTMAEIDLYEDGMNSYSYIIKGIPVTKKGNVLIGMKFNICENGLFNINIQGMMNKQNDYDGRLKYEMSDKIRLIPKYKIKKLLEKLSNQTKT